MTREVRNQRLYHDRTVQDWHRATLPDDAYAMDVDLMGYCGRRGCSRPLYLIEATTEQTKDTRALQALGRLASVPVLVIRHDCQTPMYGREVWPHRRIWVTPDRIADALLQIRRVHNATEHGRATP